MNQEIGGLISDVLVLGIFIYLSLILLRKVTPKKPIKAFENPTAFIKIVVFGGTIIFAILLMMDLVK